ncbi:MAG: DUF4296 domain-containing protein [Muribaculaceae bacterium]|nr:DUF4296 domain-containing protein [Muribaculaceae bacterium]
MRAVSLNISLLLLLALSLLSCDKTPRGVLSVNDMADLIVDLQLADAYIESNAAEFDSDSSKLIIKQSVFKKHGITAQEYDSSLVWYAHNMEDYIKAQDKAVGILKQRYDKLDKGRKDNEPSLAGLDERQGGTRRVAMPEGARGASRPGKHMKKLSTDVNNDTVDLWQGRRCYALTSGAHRGFITFDMPPDANKRSGDRYQLAYKLFRGTNQFKVCLSVDYTDGSTSQIARGSNSDGWVTVDLQSDTTRKVRRVYGYVSYDIKRGQVAYVDSLMLMRTRMNLGNYGLIHGQRLLERRKK